MPLVRNCPIDPRIKSSVGLLWWQGQPSVKAPGDHQVSHPTTEDALVAKYIYSIPFYFILINGILNSIKQEDLEDKVRDIMKAVHIEVKPDEIEDCHRIGKANPKTTIVRFVNRKNVKKLYTVERN